MKCAGCGAIGEHTKISLTNGGLTLCRVCLADVNRKNPEVAMHRAKAGGEYWVWQGDGTDHLESLVCPVLIRPDQLAALAEHPADDGESAGWRKEAWIVHTTLCKERVGTEADARFCALALAGEVGELCNLIKKQWRAEWGYPPDDPERLRREMADEIADSMVYLFLLAKTLGFDLDAITADKWERVKPRYGPEVKAALAGA